MGKRSELSPLNLSQDKVKRTRQEYTRDVQSPGLWPTQVVGQLLISQDKLNGGRLIWARSNNETSVLELYRLFEKLKQTARPTQADKRSELLSATEFKYPLEVVPSAWPGSNDDDDPSIELPYINFDLMSLLTLEEVAICLIILNSDETLYSNMFGRLSSPQPVTTQDYSCEENPFVRVVSTGFQTQPPPYEYVSLQIPSQMNVASDVGHRGQPLGLTSFAGTWVSQTEFPYNPRDEHKDEWTRETYCFQPRRRLFE